MKVPRFPGSLGRVKRRRPRPPSQLRLFAGFFFQYFYGKLVAGFRDFEGYKRVLVKFLIAKRGRYTRSFTHTGMATVFLVGIMMSTIIADSFPGFAKEKGKAIVSPGQTIQQLGQEVNPLTQISEKPRDKIIMYTVTKGDTLSTIARRFNVSLDTIKWANKLKSVDDIKPGDQLRVPPVTGVLHVVKPGETVHSIAEKYHTGAQGIVDFPFNTFTNDETFELAVGQVLVVPGGVILPPKAPKTYWARRATPDAGTVVASGSWIWPASGELTQYYAWYHRAIDIANPAAPSILAADAGTVVVAGWPDGFGYGNRVMIDHGNGFQTLYAHLSRIAVRPGQTVNRGDVIGRMGSTGRSTGTHLHFEIRFKGVGQNPLAYLK